MINPVLVEVTRAGLVESRHRGTVAVALASGETLLELGDTAAPVYPRSAVKPMQALATVAEGAVDHFDLEDDEVAVMCSSHNGEERHIQAVRSILKKIGRQEADLECGAHWPLNAAAARELARQESEPAAIHNNCSGKHAGMLALARLMEVGHQGNIAHDHPEQIRIREVLAAFFGALLGEAPCGTDGCSVPTYALPPSALAAGFARFGAGEGVSQFHAQGARTIARAIATNPFMIAGSDRFCNKANAHCGARALNKVGAEGMMCAALPERSVGIAVKCDDGASRGAEVIMAHLLAAFGAADPTDPAFVELMTRPIRNANAIHTGDIRAAPALIEALSGTGQSMIA